MKRTGATLSGIITASLLALIAAGALITAHTYSRSSGLFPKFAGWIFLVLTLMEVVAELKPIIAARTLRRPAAETEWSAGKGIDIRQEMKGFLWLVALLASIYLAGFLVAIPLYIFAFLSISAGRSLRSCAITAALATGAIYLLFVALLEYRLYSGILFGA